jgi:hypothetical protein
MSDEPTVEQLRRYLQEQLIEAENIVGKKAKAERMWALEAALQEAINFTNEVEIRNELDSIVFEESAAVRLLSPSTEIDEDTSKLNSGECPKCDEPLDGELGFCPACGYKK